MSHVTFTFAKKVFDGPVYDNEGRLVYNLYTEKATLKTKPTIISRPNGERVGELAWGGLSHGKKIGLHGQTFNSLLTKRTEHWYSDTDYCLSDSRDNHFFWRGKNLHHVGQNNRIVAVWHGKVEHLMHDDEPAKMDVERDVLYMLDMILFTALEVEWKRKEQEGAQESGEFAGEALKAVLGA